MNYLLLTLLSTTLSLGAGASFDALPNQPSPTISQSFDGAAERLDEMPADVQLEKYFGAKKASTRTSSVRGASRAYSLSRMTGDPALRLHFDAIEASWLVQGPSAPPRPVAASATASLVEAKVIVSRNLFLRGGEATQGSVVDELTRLSRARDRLAGTSLFRGRTVIYAASDDRMRDGRHQFGRLANQSVLRRDADRFYFFRGDEAEGPAGADADLEELLRREERVTFVFEGHGRDDALKLGRALKARRLASILSSRPAHLPSAIVILDACRSHDFARNVLEEMRRLGSGARLPVMIVPDEYGQSLLKDVFGGEFLRQELAAGADGPTIGTALQSRSRRLSVYAPDDRGVPMQIG